MSDLEEVLDALEISADDVETDDPKYQIRIRGATRGANKEVSAAQVQFWPEYVENFKESVEENTLGGTKSSVNVKRVDLLTNEYHPEFIKRLDQS